MPAACVVVGDLMMDVTARFDTAIAYASDTPARVSLQPGGSGANTAAWLADAGVPVTFVGCVGDDPFGRSLLDTLQALGVDARLRVIAGEVTGTCVVLVDDRHERTMFPDPGANACLLPADVITVLDEAHRQGGLDHLHLSGYTLLSPSSRAAGLAAIDRARELGATISLDPASAGPLSDCLDLFRSLLGRIDVLIANEAEATVLTGLPVAQALTALARSVGVVVIKRGPDGAVAAAGPTRIASPARAVAVVDTTGAGDAFAAGFLPVWWADRDLADAVAAGQERASQAVGRVGASPMIA